MKVKDIEFIMQAKYKREDDLPEFAFVGRSNAGKSNLINCLLNKKINRVSKKPGCTRMVNKIRINNKFYIVDLPGYGFAKVALKEKKRFSKITEDYLVNSENLKLVFVIMDIVVAPTKLDMELIDWLKNIGVNFILVFNKIDKIGKNKIGSRKKEIFKKLGFKYPSVEISAVKKLNIKDVEDYLFI